MKTTGRTSKVDLGKQKAANLTGPMINHTLSSIENATGGHGNDKIIGDRGANVLDGRAGNDVLAGKGGDDTFLISEGSDTLKGGRGSDTVFFDVGDAATASALFFYGSYYSAYGHDDGWVEATVGWSLDVDLSKGTLQHSMGDGGSARLVSIENLRLVDGFGDDRVIGSAADNEIWVGGGANWVDAGAGDDTIYGGGWGASDRQPVMPAHFGMSDNFWQIDLPSSAEILRGGAGDDIIFGSGKMVGGSGDDSLTSTVWRI